MSSKRAALDKVAAIPGWLSGMEAEFLYEAARRVERGVILEIGSWQGRSTVALASGSRAGHGVPVYAVDHFSGSIEHRVKAGDKPVWTFDAFTENVREAGVADLVRPIVAASTEAAKTFNEPIGLLFIDGDHSYAGARGDYDAWVPKVLPGGTIAMHDTRPRSSFDGPHRVVSESMYGRLASPHTATTITAARLADATRADRWRWPYVMAIGAIVLPIGLAAKRLGLPPALKRFVRGLTLAAQQ